VLARGFQAADADDLIAATFEVAWRRLDAVPAGEDALPWLLSTARNLARNADRKTRREQALVNGLTHARPMSAADLDQSAERDGVRLALAQLRPVDRDLILLVAWDGLSPARAGSVLGLLPVTARSRLHRARQRPRARSSPWCPCSASQHSFCSSPACSPGQPAQERNPRPRP
jgi:RNA polymerase sigma-70 factor (ECF subfamily)